MFDEKYIQELLAEFKETFMSENFEWRRGQKETIMEIVKTYFEKKYHTIIIDAPTGSGKSIISICAAWILNKHNKRGYILASDISLQEQYETDLYKQNIHWGSIKGLANYTCIDNDEKVILGTCKLQRKHPKSLPCYSGCHYYSARDLAVQTPTSILNYAYWLTVMNSTCDRTFESLFVKRDFTFCDEAHKILDIVQNMYSPRLNNSDLDKFEKLIVFFKNHNIDNLDKIFTELKHFYNKIKDENNQDNLLELLKKVIISLEQFKEPNELLLRKSSKEHKHNLPKDWKLALWNSEWLTEFKERLINYVIIIEKTTTRNLIKNPSGNDIIFNCLEENYLMHHYFHKHTGFRILLSATFSEPTEYLKSIALNGAKYIKMENTFDYTKSPIHFYNKNRLSFKNINANIPWINETINEIIENHAGESGLIHSASYDLAMKIYTGLTPKNQKRVLIYSGTEEKRNYIEELKRSKDKILIGPSLLEGLDMKDDFSRFQIFAKIPYPSLADAFIKIKSELNPDWYKWKTVQLVLQGTGRIVRSQTDYGITYFLDGALGDLIHYNRKAFPVEFIQRLKLISG